MPFRYSGSKKRFISKLPAPPKGTRRIVEPFAGSLAYSVHYKPKRAIGYEVNTDVAELWRWLREEATTERLLEFEDEVRALPDKYDLRELDTEPALRTLARLHTASVMVGQLSSWRHYAQHRVDFSGIADELSWIQSAVKLRERSFERSKKLDGEWREKRTLFFIDPPYLGTSGNYKDKTSRANRDLIDVSAVAKFCAKLRAPAIFTYGDDAVEAFPMFEWQVFAERRVPNIRHGGSKLRREHVCLLNWKW